MFCGLIANTQFAMDSSDVEDTARRPDHCDCTDRKLSTVEGAPETTEPCMECLALEAQLRLDRDVRGAVKSSIWIWALWRAPLSLRVLVAFSIQLRRPSSSAASASRSAHVRSSFILISAMSALALGDRKGPAGTSGMASKPWASEQ